MFLGFRRVGHLGGFWIGRICILKRWSDGAGAALLSQQDQGGIKMDRLGRLVRSLHLERLGQKARYILQLALIVSDQQTLHRGGQSHKCRYSRPRSTCDDDSVVGRPTGVRHGGVKGCSVLKYDRSQVYLNVRSSSPACQPLYGELPS